MTKDDVWWQFHRFQGNREKFYSPKFLKALKEQYRQFLSSFKAGKGETQSLMSVTGTRMAQIIKHLYVDAGTVYGAKVRAYLPKKETKARMPIGFNQRMIDLINAYYESDILNAAEEITETTRGAIQQILIEANQFGYGIDWITEQIEVESDNIQRSRARTIARTETLTGANKGAMLAAMDTGLLMDKEWLSARDARVRVDHQQVNGTVTELDGWFTVGGATMQQPGDRVQQNGLPVPAKEVCNCRCVVTFKARRDGNGQLIPHDYSQMMV